MKKKPQIKGWVGISLMLAFFYLPIVILMVFSFNNSRSLTHWTGFSTQWYSTLLKDRDMMNAVWTSLIVALIATPISTIVGTLSAIGISEHRPIVKKTFLQINQLPIVNPEIVTAIGFMILFASMPFFADHKGFATMLIAHITFCIPYVIMTILPKLKTLDPSLANAAMDLGATPKKALTSVILPQLMPAIISGALIAFTMSFDDFVISYFVTGNGVSNISIMVYTMSKRINPTINALSTIIIVMITIGLLLLNVMPIIKKRNEAKRKVEFE